MHLWHDIPLDENTLRQQIPVVIEISKGSKNKYEIDKETGLLFLDRVLHSAVHYPANYGFIPRTYCEDGDALDALVLTQEALLPNCVVPARVVGVMKMRDDKGEDDKIIAVNAKDPWFRDVHDLQDLRGNVVDELCQFFKDYKVLENKSVEMGNVLGAEAALQVLRQSIVAYKELQGR